MLLGKFRFMSILSMIIFFGMILGNSNLEDTGLVYAESFSYDVINPEFNGNATSGIVNEFTNKAYITDFFGGKLLVLDGNTNEIMESIKVVRTPFGVGINPETNLIYVGGEYANTLSILNITKNKEIDKIALEDPYDIAVDSNSNKIFVTSDRKNLVYVIDGKSNEIVSTFKVLIPCGIAVNSVLGMVYVTSESENQVHVWDEDTAKEVAIIKVGESPRGVTVNPKTNMIYVTNQEDNTISVIDGSKNMVTDVIEVGEIPRRVVVDSQSNIIYVSNQESKNISVIDGNTNQEIKKLPVLEPFELAINSKTGKLYSMYYGGGISIISKSSQIEPPLKQMQNGIEPKEIQCSNNLVLVLKNSNFNPACVKPSTAQKLIDRGWGIKP